MKKQKQESTEKSVGELKVLLEQKSAELELKNRELEIEAALEKVRSRSLAMHKSDELQEVITVINQQLNEIGIKADHVTINIPKLEANQFELWTATSDYAYSQKVIVPIAPEAGIFNMEVFKSLLSQTDFTKCYSFEEKNTWWNYMFENSDFRNIPEERKRFLLEAPTWNVTVAVTKNAILMAGNYSKNKFLKSDILTLKRFAHVFEQAYIRFLDLEKAEAQAREAQIEAALERVRAKSMAMHKSEELRELVFEFYKQIHPFGFAKWGFEIKIAKEDKSGFYCWISPPGARIQPESFNIPTLDHWVLEKYWSIFENQLPIATIEVSGDDKKRLGLLLLKKSDMKHLPQEVKTNILDTDYVHFSVASMRFGLLKAVDIEPIPEKDINILQRFAKVFEQTYTRFLDLQKAETQAREAQIEAALERVRSRTMAMQRSEELADVATVLFQQVKALGVPQWTCGFNIWEIGDTVFTFYPGSPDGDILPPCKVPFTENTVFKLFDESRRRGDELCVYESKDDIQKEHYRYMAELPGGLGDLLQNMVKAGMEFPTFQIDHLANFSHGNLLFITYEHFPEMHDIFKRFAKVFEQTYTRFLDLQKAEAQAREAQIESALERIRARALAMHHSEELEDVAHVLREQMRLLDQPELDGCVVELYEVDPDKIESWYAFPTSASPNKEMITGRSFFDKDSCSVTQEMIKKYKSPERSYTIKASGEKLAEWNDIVLKNVSIPIGSSVSISRNDVLTMYYHCSDFSGGTLLTASRQEPLEVVKKLQERVALVFNLAYKRFRDLQKAEEQAREAQIEATLERVRARTMAMHKSDELSETAQLLFNEIQLLGIRSMNCGFNIFESNKSTSNAWVSLAGETRPAFRIPHSEDRLLNRIYKAWKTGESFYQEKIGGKELRAHNEYMSTLVSKKENKKILKNQGIELSPLPAVEVMNCAFFKQGYLIIITSDLNPNSEDLFKRFAKVFEQTYTRFLDLQKAEAQAREAQIEAAMERVRARSMAMHKSEELGEVSILLYEQLKSLGVGEFINCGYVEVDQKRKIQHAWMTRADGSSPGIHQLPLVGDDILNRRNRAWKKQQEIFYQVVIGDELKKHLEFASTYFGNKEINKMVESFPDTIIFYCGNFPYGYLHIVTGIPLSVEAESILARFTKVFEQTYTRFLDLQKAEAQAREAQIETSIERVRASAMAMHNSEELTIVAKVLYKELKLLGLTQSATCGFVIVDEKERIQHYYGSPAGKNFLEHFTFPLTGDQVLRNRYDSWKRKDPVFIQDMGGKKLKKHLSVVLPDPEIFEAQEKAKLDMPDPTHFYFGNFAYGYLQLIASNSLTEDQISILPRFAKVFEQTYTRFLDLQKAEAQAREAQIEAALERVRAKAMSMHSSEDISDATGVVFSELENLGIVTLRCGIGIMSDKHQMLIWTAISEQKADVARIIGSINMKGHKVMAEAYRSWENQDAMYCYELEGKALKSYYKALSNDPNYPIPEMNSMPEKHTLSTFNFKEGLLFTFTKERLLEKSEQILGRFTNVFALTYRRYLDLVQAEAQAREAHIEAALERIRSKTMAMHNSNDVGVTVVTLFNEVLKLDFDKSLRCGLGILEGTEQCETWSATSSPNGKVDLKMGYINMTIHPMLVEVKKAWKSKKKGYYYEFIGKDVTTYYKALNDEPEYPFEVDLETLPEKLIQHSFFFSSGILFVVTENPIPEEGAKVLNRFASVFGQTYRRYLDLQKAETQAKEAIKQASLDRVRGEIASMRSKDDLGRITPLIWQELTALDVPFIRCGVFIMDEENKIIQSHLSSPDGKSLGLLNLPYESEVIGNNALKNWRKGKIYKDHWDKDQFLKFMQRMVKLGQVDSLELYQGAASPPESLDLHFVPFKQGMFYVGNTEPLIEEEIRLVQSLAEAFSIAYARYEDFSQLEQAKNQIEQALSELKSTQTQLIHSEKMASLGELTAGIAHEIQNPLNFVNNFSEVSADLIEEMKEELQDGNDEEVIAISQDLLQNLEKIRHHGQRASSIVKGMLEHSRTGTPTKELTDLNALADEYVRLAYHGFRAKDQSFNANFKTELDEKLPKVKVISQDIGRVILNMINNAFYAVSSKAKSSGNENYKPEVMVSTKLNDKKVEIVIQDNGDGIPQKNIDKIFQPFFTTKPTGQGTGLGLSLSYDIVTKGHNGHLEVESDEGIGTRFIIEIPLTT